MLMQHIDRIREQYRQNRKGKIRGRTIKSLYGGGATDPAGVLFGVKINLKIYGNYIPYDILLTYKSAGILHAETQKIMRIFV
jgi:hypothetical protein